MAVPVYQLIRSLRSFDGSTVHAETWLRRFEQEVTDAGKDEKWAIENLDRVLNGKARNWWSSVGSPYENGLDANNCVARWVQIKQLMIRSFGRNALKEQAKLQAKQLKFCLGDDPQEYVFRKMELLALIDVNMTHEEKLTYLESGLPHHIGRTMALSTDDTTTADQFIKRLRKFSRLETSFQSRKNSSERSSSRQESGFPRFQKMESEGRKKGKEFSKPETRTCFKCNKVGHLARNCTETTKANDEKPGPSKKYGQKVSKLAKKKIETENVSESSSDSEN